MTRSTIFTWRRILFCPCMVLLCMASHSFALTLQGQFRVHDPSRITKCGARYYVYCTGGNVPMHYSEDLIHWSSGPAALSKEGRANGIPTWARALVPGNKGSGVWAPDVLYFDGLYHLYYAFADWDTNDAAIGLLTNLTLDPSDEKYVWTDQGEVIHSKAGDTFNAIDPAPTFDQEGNLWLVFGNMHTGSHLIQLDKRTGLRSTTDATMYQFAGDKGEAPYIYFHDGYYYFFKNHGSCCQGVKSTYRIMMGRSKKITGPYLDKEGKDLQDLKTTEGSKFLTAKGDEIGPGHIGIFSEGGVDRISFHYYNAKSNGTPTLGIKTLSWGADGWPIALDDPAP
ncbi:intracellular endo-alpha-(1-_5)-L-arabinanase [Abditibacteriota bacterium]|nr:intracellular endo-alpha-(1->5)-L-arabinanase [Abditibacteriota bacterium]